ncbi:hypothetical protein GGS26DRAFT_454286 [Hypomontagnella submonticulosa]|nr:hypothetical protein GGS26DRAFT_454286 [Hypomontagnella submonticulosa]
MAPAIYRRDTDDVFTTQSDIGSGDTMQPWLIAVIILGVLIVVSLVVVLVLYLTRKRQRTSSEDQGSSLGRPSFKKRKTSSADRQAAEELERATMIRKSLASRTSSRTSGVWENENEDYPLEELDREESAPAPAPAPVPEPRPSRDNWKEFEAGAQSQGAIPGVHNTEMGIHPALLPQSHLAVPEPSRAPSPIRGTTPPRLIIPTS